MKKITIRGSNISKEFNRRVIFRDVNFSLSTHQSLAITGPNGSGKSTLVKIMAGVLSTTLGSVEYEMDGSPLKAEDRRDHIGFVSPYLQLYDEFSALENIIVLNRIRSNHREETSLNAEDLLEKVGLLHRKHDFVRGFSSGMKQRLKYALALSINPDILILDEPTSNLDKQGVALVQTIVQEQTKRGLLFVATNDAEEAAWCQSILTLA